MAQTTSSSYAPHKIKVKTPKFSVMAAVLTATAGQLTLAATANANNLNGSETDQITGHHVLDPLIKIVLPLISGVIVPLFNKILQDRSERRQERREERKFRELELMAELEKERLKKDTTNVNTSPGETYPGSN